ncbi:MAG: CheR family methyltransferase [Dissulfurimicrobium sp.]|uniref:CheR family methyltransferase n=1 Tax=Dissulfurimicrobium sp. TaxID=2022436 RepID=UPI003D0EF5E1
MITPEQFRFFADLVRSASGISLTMGKEYLVESRLNELSKLLNLRDIDELYHKAVRQMTPQLKNQIIEAMTTNETYFFRDQHPFDALKTKVIPELLAGKGADAKLKFWSAACSTGQEPYSIAMIIAEHFRHLANGKVEILATDISKQVIEKGAAGRFTQVEANRGLPITMLIKYFRQQGAFWVINDDIKNMVYFKILNLIDPFTGVNGFDVIFCRYVLIYFDQETKQQIIQKLEKALNLGGYLFFGATETPTGLSPAMERLTIGKTTCWRKKRH